MRYRSKFLSTVYKFFPFPLQGDLVLPKIENCVSLSCIINFYGRINLLEGILFSLTSQNLAPDKFEVILVEDRGGTTEGKACADRFEKSLNIRYYPLTSEFGMMGYSRNFGLSKARGRLVLFLDDDTVILEKDFLSKLLSEFSSSESDAIVPHAEASYYLLKEHYGYLDEYFPANRCMAYRRDLLWQLGGFISNIIGQEDVEFAIRFVAAGKKYHYSKNLHYYHPPLVFGSTNKAVAVGYSFAQLRYRYPLLVFIMLVINSARYVPLFLIPLSYKWKMQGRFSIGFLKGILASWRGNKVYYQDVNQSG